MTLRGRRAVAEDQAEPNQNRTDRLNLVQEAMMVGIPAPAVLGESSVTPDPWCETMYTCLRPSRLARVRRGAETNRGEGLCRNDGTEGR